MGSVIRATTTEHGHWTTQTAFAYEVRMTSRTPDAKWRSNHCLLVLAGSVESAIRLATDVYPDDAIVDQVCLRNKSMDVVIDDGLIPK